MKRFETEHYQKVREIDPECMVLLKSDDSFPISLDEKISLYGSGARHTYRGGTGGGIVEVRSFTTIEQGLKNAGFEIVSGDWLDGYDAVIEESKAQHNKFVKNALATDGLTGLGALSLSVPEPEYDLELSGKSDVAIYVLSRVSGEGADRTVVEGDVFLTRTEIRDITRAAEKYPKFMLVLNVSGVVDISPIVDKVQNILLLSQLGSVTGDAFADVLCGRAYPSGKLASTWAKYEDYSKEGDVNPPDDTRYKEGIYVGYRYFDSVGKQPIFPFGFGLGYTTFQTDVFKPAVKGTKVAVPVAVKNAGEYKGKETVQVYVSLPQGKLDQPYQVLAAFQKTKELKAGQSQVLNISFDIREISAFDNASCCRILENGDYILRVGNSSRNTEIAGIVRLDKTTVVEKLTHVGGVPDFDDFKPNFAPPEENYQGVPVLEITSVDINEITHKSPETDKAALDFVKGLSDEELCYLCTGLFEDDKNVGLGGASVPGAAGQTTLLYKRQGIDTLIMADGPAGLHISGQYGVDEKGKYAVVSKETKAIKELLPPEILKYLLVIFPDAANEGRGGEIFDQYCTALPIETALAQSWNPDVCELCGDLVGAEMEEYGVDFHLAPALNIHRHILCGRDFEYFSEDPYLSGKMAVGIINGVQSHKGKGSMPKHFVCNEQDTNRLNSNSIVSERALRDIYMRPFEIAVKEGKPQAIMTSYNLLNGVHTSERADLMNVLREEWGFDGIVVSDWVGYKKSPDGDMKHPRARAHKSIAAGNDLMMPGGKGHYDELLENLQDSNSPLTREIMEQCAARIVAVTKKMKGAN